MNCKYGCKKLWCTFVFAVLVASCGDKKSFDDSLINPASPNGPAVENVQVSVSMVVTSVTLDPALPTVVASNINKIISPLGESSVGFPLTIPSNAGSETIILGIGVGVDNLRYAILAAMASSDNTVLSVESTAIAFCRIAFGKLPVGISTQKINIAIRDAPEFSVLTQLISAAVEEGEAPLESPAIADSILNVLSHVTLTLATSPVESSPFAQSKVMLPIIEAVSSIPFTIISDTGGLGSVYIKGGNVDIVNSMQIFWSAKSSAIPGKTFELPAVPIDAKLLDLINNPWIDINPEVIPGNEGKGFDLTIEQNSKTRQKNIAALMNRMFLFIGDLLLVTKVVPENCRIKLLTTLISSDEYLKFSDDTSPEQFKKYVSSIVFKSAAIDGIVSTCIKEAAVQEVAKKSLGTFAAVIAKGVSGFAISGKVYDAVGIASSITQLHTYWNRSDTVAVCESAQPTGLFNNTRVTSCLSSIEFEPKLPAMVIGSSLDPVIKALDEKGKPTYFPAGIKVTSLDSAVATIDPKTARIKAIGLGKARINIFDPFTGVTGIYVIDVVNPVIKPAVLNLPLSGLGNLELYSSDGRKVIARGSRIKWAVENKFITKMTFLSWGYPAGVNLFGVQNGKTRVSITGPQTANVAPATVTVGAGGEKLIEIVKMSCREFTDAPYEFRIRFTTIDVVVNGPVGSAVEIDDRQVDKNVGGQFGTVSCGTWTGRIGIGGVFHNSGLPGDANWCQRASGDPAQTRISTVIRTGLDPTNFLAFLYGPQGPEVTVQPTGEVLDYSYSREPAVCSQER